jgi:hypothetical protein
MGRQCAFAQATVPGSQDAVFGTLIELVLSTRSGPWQSVGERLLMSDESPFSRCTD